MGILRRIEMYYIYDLYVCRDIDYRKVGREEGYFL